MARYPDSPEVSTRCISRNGWRNVRLAELGRTPEHPPLAHYLWPDPGDS